MNPFVAVTQGNISTHKGALKRWDFSANALNALEMHACVKSALACVSPLYCPCKMWYNICA